VDGDPVAACGAPLTEVPAGTEAGAPALPRAAGLNREVASAAPAPAGAAPDVGRTGSTSVTGSGSAPRDRTNSEPTPPPLLGEVVATASEPARTADRRIIQSIRSTAAAATLTPTDTQAHSTLPVSNATTSRPNAIRTRIRTSSSTIHSVCGGVAALRPPHRPV
jgi:hypothetical protein